MPWPVLDKRAKGLAVHRGRTWTENDHQTRADIIAQTAGPLEVGDVGLRIPTWLVDQLDGCELTSNPRERMMLAVIVWAYLKFWGGVRLTRYEWMEVLLCKSTATIDNYLRRLEAKRLIVRIDTLRPSDRDRGSVISTLLVRPGDALLELLERMTGNTAKARKAGRRELTKAARERRRQWSGEAWARREARRARESGLPARPQTPERRSAAATKGWDGHRARTGRPAPRRRPKPAPPPAPRQPAAPPLPDPKKCEPPRSPGGSLSPAPPGQAQRPTAATKEVPCSAAPPLMTAERMRQLSRDHHPAAAERRPEGGPAPDDPVAAARRVRARREQRKDDDWAAMRARFLADLDSGILG